MRGHLKLTVFTKINNTEKENCMTKFLINANITLLLGAVLLTFVYIFLTLVLNLGHYPVHFHMNGVV